MTRGARFLNRDSAGPDSSAGQPGVDGKEHYRRLYTEGLELEARWLEWGARDKTDSIEYLLARHDLRPESLIELGAGTGAIIAECQRRGLAREFWAVDYAPSAVSYIRETLPDVHVRAADITAPGFSLGRHFDVVVLSHVIEHLEEPDRILGALRRMDFGVCVLEVPLDDLPVSRLKNRFRNRLTNAAGHVRFFTGASFEALVRANGLEILDRRRYAPVTPIAALRFQGRKDGWGPLRLMITLLTANLLPSLLGPLWSRLYWGSYATLCRKSGSTQ